VDAFALFFNLLHLVRVRRKDEDKFWWVSSRRLFDVRSFDNVLACNDVIFFPWNSIWQTKVSLRATFFARSRALEKIITMDNLRKQHVIVVDRCCMCKRNEEFIYHLLLHCKVACTL
jgi:hypothetical protein